MIKLSKDIAKVNKLGFYFFQIGVFLLASAFSISLVFFLLSFILGSYIYFKEKKFNKYDLPIIISFLVLPIILYLQNLSPYINSLQPDPNMRLLGIWNWLPFFLGFLFFKSFLETEKQREITAKIFVVGTLPVLISGFGQYWFDWFGPLKTLNGLIIWFQKPIDMQGLSGLFSNQNYAGAWLNFVFPFCMASFLKYTKFSLKKNISLIFLISITIAILLTKSRNAWGGLIFSIPLLLGVSSLFWIIPILIFIFIGIYFASSESLNLYFQEYARNILPDSLWKEFSSENFIGRQTRISIWTTAINLIKARPIIGYGAGSFSLIYFQLKSAYSGHAHNLPIEVAYNFGLPFSIFLFSYITYILIITFDKLIKNNYFKNNIFKINLFERAWWTSFLILCISNLLDVVLYDGRLRLVFWILFIGCVQITKNNQEPYKLIKNIPTN